MKNLTENVRSIVLSYVRAALVFAVAAVGGGIDPTKVGDVWWSVGVGALWAAIPAALRVAETFLGGAIATSFVGRVALSFARAIVATGLMTLVGPLEGANVALKALALAVVPALLRALQEGLDATAPPEALARLDRTVIEAPKPPTS